MDNLPLEGIQIIVPTKKNSNKALIKNPEKFNNISLYYDNNIKKIETKNDTLKNCPQKIKGSSTGHLPNQVNTRKDKNMTILLTE